MSRKKAPYKLVKRIKSKGWPVSSHKYRKAHKEADKRERKRFGKRRFKEVEAIAKKIPKGELAGKHTKTGKVIISKRVPEKYRSQIAYHERTEHRLMTKRGK